MLYLDSIRNKLKAEQWPIIFGQKLYVYLRNNKAQIFGYKTKRTNIIKVNEYKWYESTVFTYTVFGKATKLSGIFL